MPYHKKCPHCGAPMKEKGVTEPFARHCWDVFKCGTENHRWEYKPFLRRTWACEEIEKLKSHVFLLKGD